MNCCTSTQRQAALAIHSCVSRAHFPSFLPHQNGGTKINLQLSPFRFLKEPKMQWRRGRSDNAQFNEGRRGKSRNSHDTSSVKRNGFRKGNFRPLSLFCRVCRVDMQEEGNAKVMWTGCFITIIAQSLLPAIN